MGRRLGMFERMAREAAKQARVQEQAYKAAVRAAERAKREAVRTAAQQAKEEKQRYLDARQAEADDLTGALGERIEELRGVLAHTLDVDDTIEFDSLRPSESFPTLELPKELTTVPRPPVEQNFLAEVPPLGFFAKWFAGARRRHEEKLEAARAAYAEALLAHAKDVEKRKAMVALLKGEHDAKRAEFEASVRRRNQEVDALARDYKAGEADAVETYCSMVLERSEYPEGFPQEFRVVYLADSKQLVVEYQLPSVEIVPAVSECRYVKTKDVIEDRPRKPAEVKELYRDVVASVCLRTIHELFEADQGSHLDVVAFNGFVDAVDPATGKDIRPCVVTVRSTAAAFGEINLARVDKLVCLRNLGAQVSSRPDELVAVKPVVEFDMVDRRFVDQRDIVSGLDGRPNLMELDPFEFENLISNLFSKMGFDTKQTRSSRDGGVDAVAFDPRPIVGGKVVIQAKRWSNTVGVSAVRDLYGTMINEGASKGIIVSTSSYGPDAYEFAKTKPIELIDGGGLLYLMEQQGIKARIVFLQG